MIFTINTNGYLLYSVAKSTLQMSDEDVYNMINHEFSVMVTRLEKKGVKYDTLKRALTPNQDKDNNEVCLIFDSCQIDSPLYGYTVFNEVIPLMDRSSAYSILAGDYIDVIKNNNNSQKHLLDALKEFIIECNTSDYHHSSQYYLVYFNSITNNQLSLIISKLQNFKWFYGYALLNSNSRFKTYLSFILSHVCVKTKNTVIVNHPSDYDDDEIVNMTDYPFEENGFNLISINDDSFGPFLSYKIESIVPDKDDISFSFNALFQKFDSIDKLDFDISDEKWGYLIGDCKGKGGIIKSFDFDDISKNEFRDMVFKKICSNYIYNLRKNEYGDLLFNVCVEMPTKNGNIRRTTIALKYYPNCGKINIVTMT